MEVGRRPPRHGLRERIVERPDRRQFRTLADVGLDRCVAVLDDGVVPLPRSVLTSPLCAAADAALAPTGFRRKTWNQSLAEHRKTVAHGDDGAMGWAAGLWLGAFFPLLIVILIASFLIPGLDQPGLWRQVTTWLLGIPLVLAPWCLIRHVLSSGKAQPNLLDDLTGALLALALLLIPLP